MIRYFTYLSEKRKRRLLLVYYSLFKTLTKLMYNAFVCEFRSDEGTPNIGIVFFVLQLNFLV